MIVVIDYDIGNTGSVINALDKLGLNCKISNDPDDIRKADALILPGVGAAGQGMSNLKKNGLDKLIKEEIKKGKPFLGICLGMQLLFEKSAEGNVNCLGILKGSVKKFRKMKKIPQIGWNQVKVTKETPLLEGIGNDYFYYVNSYYCKPLDKEVIAGRTSYGEEFAGVVAKDNIFGVQFHPEKSGSAGFKLLENFVRGVKNVS